jgi:hypothetical protein
VSQDFDEWLETLLAALVSLRVFQVQSYGASRPAEMYLPFVIDVSHRAHHLEYFAYHDNYQTIGGNHCWKRVCGEWVICDEAAII